MGIFYRYKCLKCGKRYRKLPEKCEICGTELSFLCLLNHRKFEDRPTRNCEEIRKFKRTNNDRKIIEELKESLVGFIFSFLESQEELHDLKTEKESLEDALKSTKEENEALRAEIEEIKANHIEQLKEEIEGRRMAIYEKVDADRKAEELKKENSILRKYYSLEREASDDIKEKIRIDFEVNRLEEEIKRLKEINSTINSMYLLPIYTPSYLYSGFRRGLMRCGE